MNEQENIIFYLGDNFDFFKAINAEAIKRNYKLIPFSLHDSDLLFTQPFRGIIVEDQYIIPSFLSKLQKFKSEKIFSITLLSNNDWSSKEFKDLKNSNIDYLIEKPLTDDQLKSFISHLTNGHDIPDVAKDKDFLLDILDGYKKSIFDKIAIFELLIARATKEFSQESIADLAKEAHKIAGSAGSYGYPKISSLCKELEIDLYNLIKELNGENGINDSQTKEKIKFYLTDRTRIFFKNLKFYFQIQ